VPAPLATSKLVARKGKGAVGCPLRGQPTAPFPLRAGLCPASMTRETGKRKSPEILPYAYYQSNHHSDILSKGERHLALYQEQRYIEKRRIDE